MATDGQARCGWGDWNDPLYLELPRRGVGHASRDRTHLFEMLVLEGAQAGLSWTTILRKRDGYRAAFAGFEPERVAAFGPDDVDRLMLDAGIVRNRAKIESAIDNARAILALERDGNVVRRPPVVVRRRAREQNRFTEIGQLPAETARVDGDVEGPEEARIPLRRPDDDVRVHAGGRAGERPHARLLPPRRGGGPRLRAGTRD